MTTGRQGYRFTLRDVAFLSSEAGRDGAAAAAALPLTDLLADLTRLRRALGEFAAAAAETALLRRRAVPKFGPDAANWLLTEEALQQGTPEPVARHRGQRLAGIRVHDLTCSIGADLAHLDAAVGSDLDPVRVVMARHNLAGRAPVFVADALTRSTRGLLGYADPGRRVDGRRITSADTVPPIGALDRVYPDRPPVLRVPPGLDFAALARPGEVEVVSLDGGVREAVLWPPELAGPARRATVLRGGTTTQYDSDDSDDVPVRAAQRLLVEPDPAVIRAGLVRHYAARHGLAQLDPHLAYLTGDRAPDGVRVFAIGDQAEFKERTVADWIRRDGVGTLEIKQRGTPVIPDELRRRLRPALSGDTAVMATLVVARVGATAQAYWCRAVDARGTEGG